MNTKLGIPNAETRAKSVRNMQEANRQFKLAILMLDEAIALVDRDLLAQRRTRLEKKATVHEDIAQAIPGEL
jgi:hypothetical protein